VSKERFKKIRLASENLECQALGRVEKVV